MEYTPTPWKKSKNVLGEFSIHWGEKADRATTVATARTEAAADQIVQAVNAHEALVSALERVKRDCIDEYGERVRPTLDTMIEVDDALKKAGVKP